MEKSVTSGHTTTDERRRPDRGHARLLAGLRLRTDRPGARGREGRPHGHLNALSCLRMSDYAHAHDHGHGHSHGLVAPEIARSREGLRVVSASLAILLATALAQAVVYAATGSVALLADLTHNFGDALTAIPLGAAFLLRSRRAERWAGGFVVLAIFVSACVAGVESVLRLADPRDLDHLGALAAAGVVGF